MHGLRKIYTNLYLLTYFCKKLYAPTMADWCCNPY